MVRYIKLLIIVVYFSIKSVLASPYAIVSAMPKEINLLLHKLKNQKIIKIEGVNFHEGQLANHDVVMAAFGVGNINSAAGSALLIKIFHPKAIILIGIAGGRVPNQIVIGSKVIYYDFATIAHSKLTSMPTMHQGSSNVYNPLYITTNPILEKLALHVAEHRKIAPILYNNTVYTGDVVSGPIVTTDQLIYDKYYALSILKKSHAIASDMESFGLAQICYQNRVPFLLIRGISDTFNQSMYRSIAQKVAINVENFTYGFLQNLPYNSVPTKN